MDAKLDQTCSTATQAAMIKTYIPRLQEPTITADGHAWDAWLSAFSNSSHARHPGTKTAATYTRNLKPLRAFFMDRGITEPERATAETLAEYRGHLLTTLTHKGRKLSDNAAAARFALACNFFRWLSARSAVADITRGIDGIKVNTDFSHAPLTLDQTRRVLNQAADLRDRAILLLMFGTGLRCAEVATAKIQGLQLEAGHQVLYVKGKGRTSYDEFVLIQPPVMAAINAYLETRPGYQPDEPLFTSKANRNRGQEMTALSLSRLVKGYLVTALKESVPLHQLERYSAHSTRHTYAHLALDAGCGLLEVQTGLRHANPKTTMRYIKQRAKYANPANQNVMNLILGTTGNPAQCLENTNCKQSEIPGLDA